ncbi:hypothetical protein EC973_004350 [Apophysomyces ossiformis]|uniref:Uncharacterized protein n=1 Tax=Apophysomyces ossiformis TaxID=679940 RepID=A0A8H7BKL7_9FUNG|nr:hypothetical protein EC973_004350 [Apophysomyces ossiformis]
MEELSDISITIPHADLLKIFGLTRLMKLGMVQAIHEYISNGTRIDVSRMTLSRIGMSVAHLANDGKIKIIPNAPKNHVLKLLEELCALADSSLV